ncbi:hypothetical protein [Niveispirillum sp. KHB5.9]|uniref:hypothetical protein n=1 Tax=Niveispirillum sp. KHB5.9 TaxID=3400269 RepID=UPI003A8A041B
MFMTIAERNKRILEAIEAGNERMLATKGLARKTLIEEGIYTEEGELTPEYGGPPRKDGGKGKDAA